MGNSDDAGMQTQRLIGERYSLLEPLPGSAVRISWRARDQWSGRQVMMTRVLVPGLVDGDLRRVRHEISGALRDLGGVRHDRVARTLDVVLDADELWVASELQPGVMMAEALARRRHVSPHEAARWGHDVADALAAAHSVGVSHGNLHAGVVCLPRDGGAVVGGFASTVVTPDGLRAGIPVQVAPEVARGAEPSPAADVFALGAMLYTAVEGYPPFSAGNRDQRLTAVTRGPAEESRRAGPLSDLLMRMLHPEAARRPDPATIAEQLRQIAAAPGAEDWTIPAPRTGTGAAPSPADPALSGPPPPRGYSEYDSRGSEGRPGAAGPSPQRRRRWWVSAVVVVAVLGVAGGLLAALRPWASTPPRPSVAAPRSPPSPIGNPRTADPCALLSMSAMQRFGQLKRYSDTEDLPSCLILIGTGGRSFVELSSTFGVPSDREPAGAAEHIGEVTVFRTVARNGQCQRTVVLKDRFRVYVNALARNGARTDLCAIADAGTKTSVVALAGGSLPRREIDSPSNSLARVDTCSLLDQAALRRVPGLEATRQRRGFAGWSCTWGDNPAFRYSPWAQVAVSRLESLTGAPVRIVGRSAQVTPGNSDNPGTCTVDLVQRMYTGTSGERRIELLTVYVSLGAQQSSDAACQSAKTLAGDASPKLPPPG